MDLDRSSTRSGSKRKRAAHNETIDNLHDGHLEVAEAELDHHAHSPKRSRAGVSQSSTEKSSTEDGGHRSLRRKKKVNNLSNLNLRHAAEQHRSAPSRESKFQEGSLSNKPSEKPPSVFTRIMGTYSGHIPQVDEMMEDYNKEAPVASTEAEVNQETALTPQREEGMAAAAPAPNEDSTGLFRLEKSLTSNFRPISLWNRLWNETKDELTRKNAEEAERRRRQKEEAEARYAELKKAGHLGLQPVKNSSSGLRMEGFSSTPRDSAVEMQSRDHSRQASDASHLLAPPAYDLPSQRESEAQDPAMQGKGTLKGRFGFTRPSISGLKRVRSDFNIAAAGNPSARESSLSLSPAKQDVDNSALRKSASRYDLKKQNRLSKRVSDLEVKLRTAREELNEALVEASPLPKLGNRYERFTPVSTLKNTRPKFVPGRLPTLPSERFLDPAKLGFGDDEESPVKGGAERESLAKNGMGVGEEMDVDEANDMLKVSRARVYPTRASSLFSLNNDDIGAISAQSTAKDKSNFDTSENTQLTSDKSNDTNGDTVAVKTSNTARELTSGTSDFGTLDAGFNAFNGEAKPASRTPAKPKSKKRKSGADDNAPFKPGKDADDDEAEWDQATPKKKQRKSGNGVEDQTSPVGKTGTSSSPQSKKSAGRRAKGKKRGLQPASIAEDDDGYGGEDQDFQADANDTSPAGKRTSMDSQGLTLEPLYEDEELETSTRIPLNDEPSKPTAKATPARHGRHAAARSRSASPVKTRRDSAGQGSEERMLTRAAEAAQGRRGGSRQFSPLPTQTTKGIEVVDETISIVPGEDGVPELPRGATGSFESLDETVQTREVRAKKVAKTQKTKKANRDDFEWPADVF